MESAYLSRMCGKLLGDGCIVKQHGRKPRFQFIHRLEDEQWAMYCYEQLESWIPLAKPIQRKVVDSRMRKGYIESVMIQSKTSPLITGLRECWYPNGTKELPFEFIRDHLDAEALAWWYQDDGHLKIHNGIMKKVVLSTDSFMSIENLFLIQLLLEKFSLRFSIDAQNRLLLYDQAQIIRFLTITGPYMQPSMARKMLHPLPLKPIAKRTTVFLPEDIQLTYPTREINEKLATLSGLLIGNGTISFDDTTVLKILNERAGKQLSKSYQIRIADEHSEILSKLRQQTGLTVSELIAYCFNHLNQPMN